MAGASKDVRTDLRCDGIMLSSRRSLKLVIVRCSAVDCVVLCWTRLHTGHSVYSLPTRCAGYGLGQSLQCKEPWCVAAALHMLAADSSWWG